MYAERIDRLLAEGVLTDAQAEALKASLSQPERRHDRPRRQASRLALLIVIICIAAVMLPLTMALIHAPGDPAGGSETVAETAAAPGEAAATDRTMAALTGAALMSLPAVLILVVFVRVHNGIADKEERVYEAWSKVAGALQSRAELVPDIVEAVSHCMRHESNGADDTREWRADAIEPLADAMNRLIADQQLAAKESGAEPDDGAAVARLAEAQQKLASSLRDMLAIAECHPTLRSGDQLLPLQSQLEDTENRINAACVELDRSVGEYNSAIRHMPGTLVASFGDFRRKTSFQADSDTG